MILKISPEIERLIAEHNMPLAEYDVLLRLLGREPTKAELGVAAAMWSEHCSYKSTRIWLKTLPTTGPQVIMGPGENAGVVDIGDGLAAVFKIESHNHPSYIEPYQGAATGVGGILRDVFTMGARPIANLNVLCFGSPEHPRTRSLVSGVVAGIGGYGNCIGVPTVAGETHFHKSYDGNCLVNAMTVGIADKKRIFTSQASGVGNSVVYVGSKTGCDGIKGATMASGEFNSNVETQRPTVQVGDPFTEKLLLEACLELMATDAIVAIQDMGAAGLTSSAVEMASKGDLGIELDLDKVPLREANMEAYEIMLSESQERMLMVLKPGREAEAEAIFRKWELDFAIIGRLTNTGRLVAKRNDKIEINIPVKPLVEQSPVYDRPHKETPPKAVIQASQYPLPSDMSPLKALLKMMSSPELCSRRWIWEQYDRHVGGNTAQASGGGDAGVVRVQGTNKGLAMTVDCAPRYCMADPVMGGKQVVAESYRNLCAVGAKPLATTDNMNFGNPEKARIMGQFVGVVQGMGEACRALDFPIVSGNCSLYNETNGSPIMPTPVIGGIGLLEDVTRQMTVSFKAEGEAIFVIGATVGHIGQSLYLKEIHGLEEGTPPPVNLTAERRHGKFTRNLIAGGSVTACHDVSDGGLLVTIAEMALAGDMGCHIEFYTNDEGFWFGEDQARYVITTRDAGAFQIAVGAAGIPFMFLGQTGGDAISISSVGKLELSELRAYHDNWLPNYMNS
ncbi:MAG: phosphoribosylformylglycinamidine synthase subunit PurL [Alphaproteobacteria bacterium]|nr:phosphoribosylformylglycinamidine synthase subunit PurL [Alphaproteobacteria bacterium]